MDKQQVITCHGEIFISKLKHKLGASAASKEIKISIRSSKHYLLLAKKSYARLDLSSVVDGLIKELHSIPSLHELHADLKQLKGNIVT